MSAFFPQERSDTGTFVPRGQGRVAAGQVGDLVSLRAIKKGGRTSNLLTSLLSSECLGTRMVMQHRDRRKFKGFGELVRSTPLIEAALPATGEEAPEGFTVLVDKHGSRITNLGTGDRFVCMRLTPVGRWAAFALLWNLSPLAICVAAVTHAYNVRNGKNETICGRQCECHGAQRFGTCERGRRSRVPLTSIMCARKFPECSRISMMRAIKELERCEMITKGKSMHCTVIVSNMGHPLFSRHSHILAKLSLVIDDRETLKSAARYIRFVRPAQGEETWKAQ